MVYIKPEFRHLLNKETQGPVWSYENNDDIGSRDERRHIAKAGGGFPPMQKRLARDRDVYLVGMLARSPYLDAEVREMLKAHPVMWIRRLAQRTPVAPEDQAWIVGRPDGGRIW